MYYSIWKNICFFLEIWKIRPKFQKYLNVRYSGKKLKFVSNHSPSCIAHCKANLICEDGQGSFFRSFSTLKKTRPEDFVKKTLKNCDWGIIKRLCILWYCQSHSITVSQIVKSLLNPPTQIWIHRSSVVQRFRLSLSLSISQWRDKNRWILYFPIPTLFFLHFSMYFWSQKKSTKTL